MASRGKILVALAQNERESQKQSENISEEDTSANSLRDFDSDDSKNDKTYNPSMDSDSASDNDSELESDISTETDDIDTEDLSIVDSNIVDMNVVNHDWQNIECGTSSWNWFNEECVLNESLSETNIKSPIDAFTFFLDDEILNLIVNETNRYATQQLAQRPSCSSKAWSDTDCSEMRIFFSVVLTMGLAPLPSLNLYWSKDEMFRNKFISSLMRRDRFFDLLKYLHFSNNETTGISSRLYKIEELTSKLLQKFQSALTPAKDIVIDESMIPFRGRLHFRQYIPSKSHRYGVKVYKLCTISGYTYNVKIYSGKEDCDVRVGHSEYIVHKLLEPLDILEGRQLYADNFYSSIPLAEKLYDKKITYCGTLRPNRKGIPSCFQRKMKRGEIYGQEKNKIKIIKWVDKRPVLMISSDPSHGDTLVPIGRKSKSGEEIKKPKCVIDYNKAKKGVDLSDQMSSYHSVLRRSRKWYRKVALELLLGTSVVNAWIVYKMIAEIPNISITEFRRQLARSLSLDVQISEPNTRKRQHTFAKPEGPGRKKRKPCRECYKNLRRTLSSREADKKVRRVISYCEDCDGQPGYCLSCFNKVHN